MDTRRVWHMFAHVIHPDIHQFTCIKCASAKLWSSSSMCSFTMKGKINPGISKRMAMLNSIKCRRMPRDSSVNIIKETVTCHISFGSAPFLSWAAIISHPSNNPVFGKPIFYSGCRQKRRCTEQIVTTTVTISASLNWSWFSYTRGLAQLRQSIKLTKYGNDWSLTSCLTHDCRRHSTNSFSNSEALSLQYRHMFSD